MPDFIEVTGGGNSPIVRAGSDLGNHGARATYVAIGQVPIEEPPHPV